MKKSLRVHISPVGYDPPERIINPLIESRADRVYLVSSTNDDSVAEANVKRVSAVLSEEFPTCERNVVSIQIFDLIKCIQEFRRIFVKEISNHIFVNVSTGSKITAISGMLAAMLWGGTPYYAKLNYSGASRHIEEGEVEQVDELPVYKIDLPSVQSLKVLGLLKKAKGNMTKADMIINLQSNNYGILPPGEEGESPSARHSRLNPVLQPLLENDYIETSTKGRFTEVKLTPRGSKALEIFGDGADLSILQRYSSLQETES